MPSQDVDSIRVTHTYPPNNLRLLQLPPELIEELSVDKSQPFYLKSLPPPTPSQLELKRAGKISLEQEYVNLCTRTKTYGLQQVQSSNSIILVRPEKDNRKPTGEEGEDDARLGTEDTVTVIAQCWSTLELKDYEGGVSAAVSFLEKCLPVHRLPDVEEDDMDLDDDPTTSAAATGMVDEKSVKDAVLRDVPLSPEECERGWIDICAFVDTDEMKAWRPSAKAKLEVWMKILEGSVIQGIELDKQFLVNDLWKAVSDYDGEEPSFGKELFEAVVKRLLDQEASRPWETELKWANFDKDTTVRWAAETYLEATAPTPETAMSRTEFLNKWKDNLPEIWRDQPSWANFKGGRFDYPDASTICFSKISIEQKEAEAQREANTKDGKRKLKR